MMSALPPKPVCTHCGGTTRRAFSVGDRNLRVSDKEFDYFSCHDCGLHQLWPVPPDLGRYYPDSYYGLVASADELAQAAGPEAYKVELVQQFRPAGSLLELGPGGGGFALLAKRAGFEVSVIEMGAASCRVLAEVVGVRTVQSTDLTAAVAAEERQYDVIAAWHVIEHVPDPWGLVEAAAARLAPGGVLVLAAPNPAALQFRLLGRRWVHVDAPRHLFLIPHTVLVARAVAAGLTPRLVTATDPGGLGWDRFGWVRSLRSVLPRRPDRLFGPAAERVGGLLTTALRPVERSGLRGTAYTAVFQKPERK